MEKILSSKIKNIHLVGIGGIGMSGLAILLNDKGYIVTGSDLSDSKTIKYLTDKGIKVNFGHDENLVEGKDLICISSAIKEDNPEFKRAKLLKIPIIKRGVLLSQLLEDKKVVAIAGSHGKTTTTALVSYILRSSGIDSASFFGGVSLNYDQYAWWGNDALFVVETDESDGTFTKYHPSYSVITNIDQEHMNFYKDKKSLNSAFKKFAANTKDKIFIWNDNKKIYNIIKSVSAEIITYGLSKDNFYNARNVKYNISNTSFDVFRKDKKLGSIVTPLRGEHNVLNALAAIGVSIDFCDFSKIKLAIKGFKGTGRRFDIKYRDSNFIFIDDYAHHPTEIYFTLKAAKSLRCKRLVALFQPHRYSRLKDLSREFSRCFDYADLVVVTDVYSAQEKPIKGIDGEFIYNKISKNKKHCCYIKKDCLSDHLGRLIKRGDCLISLGAGDIGKLSLDIVSKEFLKDV